MVILAIWYLYGLNDCEENYKDYLATLILCKKKKETGFNQIIRFLIDCFMLTDLNQINGLEIRFIKPHFNRFVIRKESKMRFFFAFLDGNL